MLKDFEIIEPLGQFRDSIYAHDVVATCNNWGIHSFIGKLLISEYDIVSL